MKDKHCQLSPKLACGGCLETPCQMQRKGMDPSLVTIMFIVIVKLIQHLNIIPNKNSVNFLNISLHYIFLQNKSIIPQRLLMHA
jgi:hypothetical protein